MRIYGKAQFQSLASDIRRGSISEDGAIANFYAGGAIASETIEQMTRSSQETPPAHAPPNQLGMALPSDEAVSVVCLPV